MTSPVQGPWIDLGYQSFAREGPAGLKVEQLARAVGKNKSSFYHHFADLDTFTEVLLDHHLNQARVMAHKEVACQSRDELIEIILDHKVDLLFNRQLRIHRQHPGFAACFERTNQITGPAFLGIWAKIIGLSSQTHLAELVLQLSMENFFLQITEATLNESWLQDYFQRLKATVSALTHRDH
ncbi:TetR/AcrR family transcriptional regulator [Lewinella sp. W8]|uniref:TetR/AcrR family transcriptional regulator n=1 Tax=Lewinella sp. W8 TaxID=2528208 RepID=UPI001067F9AD|nr:TetR/AcrR family transcriptional regulator [Lewinella sp. W8]MTB51740.1 TetR family transcriptional regulator [Lewinella sp. W8]